MYSTNIFTRIN